tara:strand:- start:353 stop:622 length:270 start_codon:yes stop_codon:yes gene_type:complete
MNRKMKKLQLTNKMLPCSKLVQSVTYFSTPQDLNHLVYFAQEFGLSPNFHDDRKKSEKMEKEKNMKIITTESHARHGICFNLIGAAHTA